MASYQSLPNNVILKIGENLDARDFCTLLRANKHTASVLKPFLPGLACQAPYASIALKVSKECGNKKMIRLLLQHGEMDSICRYWGGTCYGYRVGHHTKRGGGYHIKQGGPPPPVLRHIPLTLKEWQTRRDLMFLPLPEEFLSVKKGWVLTATRALF